MQKILILVTLGLFMTAAAQQTSRKPMPAQSPRVQPLPAQVYTTLRDSCTQLDIVFITGKGGSMSMDSRGSIHGFTSFVSTRATSKVPNAPQDGTIMWQIDGRAYLMGSLYLTSDSAGYLIFNKNEKEYVNALSPDGAGFLNHHGR